MSTRHPICIDSIDGDIHPALADSDRCAFHRRASRTHATNKSAAKAAGRPYPAYEPIPRTPAAIAQNPAITHPTHTTTAAAGSGDVVIVIPAGRLDRARAAMNEEADARDAWRKATPADRQAAGDRLAAAARALSQAIDPIVYANGTPD